MNIGETPDPKSSLWGAMAYYLRFYRNQHGQNQDEVAAALGCSTAQLSFMETGKRRMSEKYAPKADDLWNTGGHFGVLLYFAKRASDPDWFNTFTDQEKDADRVKIFAAQCVPGLVQTEGYASALLQEGTEPDKDASLRRRMRRQEVLTRKKPPELWIIMSENALDWPVGSRSVMAGQMARLVELAQLPHVVLRIVPREAGSYSGLDGPFMLIRGDEGEVAFVEAPKEGRLVSDDNEVLWFSERFDRIGAKAESAARSLTMLRQAFERWS